MKQLATQSYGAPPLEVFKKGLDNYLYGMIKGFLASEEGL